VPPFDSHDEQQRESKPSIDPLRDGVEKLCSRNKLTSRNPAVYDNEAIIYTYRDSVINRFFVNGWFQANGTGTVRINLTRFAYPINFGERWKGFSIRSKISASCRPTVRQ